MNIISQLARNSIICCPGQYQLHPRLLPMKTTIEPVPVVRVPLTRGKFALVDSDVYTAVSKYQWQAVLMTGNWYAIRSDNMPMARFILNAKPGVYVDHHNHNTLDNRRQNLRVCSSSQNVANSLKTKNKTTSKYKGISWNKLAKKWHAYIMQNYRRIHIGLFTSEVQAAKAYDTKARELFGEFAYTNFQ